MGLGGAYEPCKAAGWMGRAYESLEDLGLAGRGLRALVREDC